ncbi:MAG: hypothetical protein DMF65_06380 [Acidobacteria bacterium]|nr:MAG: hypothetical protein DMF65_06380 [Acidobacteriota bacterium]
MYRISARQILVIALLSALFAAAGVACFDRWGARIQQPTAAFNSDDNNAATVNVAGITDPSVRLHKHDDAPAWLLRRGRAGRRLRLRH